VAETEENDGSTDLSVVMPVYNEAATVETAIEQVLATAFPVRDWELIVVDDGSSDGSAETLRSRSWPRVRIVHHDVNMGKGAAVRTGIGHAQARS
jgi:glycosyltransferase involved in cell wall biosynthesis